MDERRESGEYYPGGRSGGDAPTIPEEPYVRNPVTGLYHKITAEANELGEITVKASQEGEERGGNVPTPLVRDPVTGLYHRLEAEVNDLGQITVKVSQEGEKR